MYSTRGLAQCEAIYCLHLSSVHVRSSNKPSPFNPLKSGRGDRKPETDTMSNRPLNLTITSSHLDICTTNFIVNIHFYFIHSYSYYIPTANASSPTKHLKTQLCYRAETRQLTLPQKCNEILVDTLERRNSRALIFIQCMTDDRSVR